MPQNQRPSRLLPVIPSVEEQRKRRQGYGYLILSPPPVPMPWGLETTRGENTGENITDGWVLGALEGKPVDLKQRSRIFLRKNVHYAEIPFESYGVFSFMLPFVYACIILFGLGYHYSSSVFFWVGLGLIATPAVCWCFECAKYPTVIFNRLRNEIYLYKRREKSIIIKNYATSVFVFLASSSWARLDIICENPPEINEESLFWTDPARGVLTMGANDNLFSLDGSRGLVSMIPAWEYIRRYMEPGDGYTLLPSYKDFFHFLPFMSLALRLDEEWLSPPHRWPPEIERLLWPENKDAPLPEGWQYDTWIPYDIPKGGFDNTELLREREERLRREAEESV